MINLAKYAKQGRPIEIYSRWHTEFRNDNGTLVAIKIPYYCVKAGEITVVDNLPSEEAARIWVVSRWEEAR